MRAGDIIGKDVVDASGRPVGVCTDLRCRRRQGPADTGPVLELTGVLVSPHHTGALLGYESGRTRGPLLLARMVGWLHRGMVLVAWKDLDVHDDLLRLHNDARPTPVRSP